MVRILVLAADQLLLIAFIGMLVIRVVFLAADQLIAFVGMGMIRAFIQAADQLAVVAAGVMDVLVTDQDASSTYQLKFESVSSLAQIKL